MAHLVITIGCEYGAKGNMIGRKVAKDLGIKFYDRAATLLKPEDKQVLTDIGRLYQVEFHMLYKLFNTRAQQFTKNP